MFAVLKLPVDGVRVIRIDTAHKAVAAADRDPIAVHRARAAQAAAWSAPTAVVLQTAVDVVRPAYCPSRRSKNWPIATWLRKSQWAMRSKV